MADIQVTKGNNLVVDSDILNIGDSQGQQDILFLRESTQEDIEADLVLQPDESQTLTWVLATDSLATGLYDIIVQSDNDESRIELEVVDSAIPDSVELQYFGDTFTTGDATWVDDNGVSDMSLNGDPQAASLSDGVASVDFDSNDYGMITMPSTLEGSSLTTHTFEIAIQWTETGQNAIVGQINDSGQRINIFINRDNTFSQDAGNILVEIQDNSSNQSRFDLERSDLNDGNRHNISLIIEDSSQDTYSAIVDGSSESINLAGNATPSSFDAWDRDMAVSARNNQGSIDGNSDINIGAIRWHNTAITSQTIGDY